MIDTILQGDVRECLKQLEDGSVQCVITSPPYFGLRDYGVAGQLGLEERPEDYVADMTAVFHDVKRVLRPDGVLWLNLGDTYANQKSGDTYAGFNARYNGTDLDGGKQAQTFATVNKRRKLNFGSLNSKDLVGIPWHVAFALQADGWILRSDIIWAKPAPMPESVQDRCTKSHEYLFMFAKSSEYHCDMQAIEEQADPDSDLEWARNGLSSTVIVPGHRQAQHRADRPSVKRGGFNGKTNELKGREAFRAVTETRNKRDVWTVATQPCAEAHFATFPPKLIEPCILAGAPVGSTVLDPFIGSGTTAIQCVHLSRHYIGCELNPEYVQMAERRIAHMVGPLFVGET